MAPGILHGIHSVFPSPAITGHIQGKDPISLKKDTQGNGQWHHKKELLGFGVNTSVSVIMSL
jgi:hypothetical protein